jgi:hypothetical protein
VPSIVGTWKLVRAVARDGGGATLPEPYGGKGIGRVTFTADGRMQSMVCDGRKEMPVGVARDYSSYCGNYTFDGTRLVTRVDAASDPSRLGSDQVRGVALRGGAYGAVAAAAHQRRPRGTPRTDLAARLGGVAGVCYSAAFLFSAASKS